MNESIYDFKVKNIKGIETSLNMYRGKVAIIVNTASKCGFTPQYQGLEKLYKELKDQGLIILGFPCNQFGNQEPAENEQIYSFCQTTYYVTFPMFAKVDVNGKEALPLYSFLKEKAPGIAGTKSIKWNFTKFLVNREGIPVKRFAPQDTPEKMAEEIKLLLDDTKKTT